VSADQAAAWSVILDRFEADIALAVSGGTPGSWTPPADVGPVPPELLERAARVLDAQQETRAILTRSRDDAAAHRDALDSVPDSGHSGHALYLDVRG
jgi:hypothetical protein